MIAPLCKSSQSKKSNWLRRSGGELLVRLHLAQMIRSDCRIVERGRDPPVKLPRSILELKPLYLPPSALLPARLGSGNATIGQYDLMMNMGNRIV